MPPMRMVLGVWMTAAAASFGSKVVAQDGDAPAKNEKPVPVRRFFERPIDYWGRGLEFGDEPKGKDKDPKRPVAGPAQKAPASDWGQVVRLPDGTLSTHELPGPLVDVLENPSPENLRAYLAFRMEKIQKILRAAELLKELRTSVLGQAGESAAPGAGALRLPRETSGEPRDLPHPVAPAPGPAQARPFTVTYFHQQHCPSCERQDPILSLWLKDKPEGKLEVIEFGSMPELWRAFQVRGTPTLILQDSASKAIVALEGLSRVDALDRKLQECRSMGREDAAAKGRGER